MKVLFLAVVTCVYAYSAHAECWSYRNSTNSKIVLTFTAGKATVSTPKFTKKFDAMSGGTTGGADAVTLLPMDDESDNAPTYRVWYVDEAGAKLRSPELARLTGGSPTFIRKCR